MVTPTHAHSLLVNPQQDILNHLLQLSLAVFRQPDEFLRPANFSWPLCGLPCRGELIRHQVAKKIALVSAIFGWPALITALMAILVLTREEKRMPLKRLTIFLNLSFLAVVAIVLMTTNDNIWAKFACHGDGTLRFNKPGALNACVVVAAVFVFFSSCFSYGLVCDALSWYRLVGKITARVLKHGMSKSDTKVECLSFLFTVLMAAMSTGVSIWRGKMDGTAITSPCLPDQETFIWLVGWPLTGCVTITIIVFLIGSGKLFLAMKESKQFWSMWMRSSRFRRLRHASARHEGSLASPSSTFVMSASESTTTMSSSQRKAGGRGSSSRRRRGRRRRKSLEVLRRLLFVLLMRILTGVSVAVVVTVCFYLYTLDTAGELSLFRRHILCQMVSCRPSHCPEFQPRSLVLRGVATVVFVFGALVFSVSIIIVYYETYISNVTKCFQCKRRNSCQSM